MCYEMIIKFHNQILNNVFMNLDTIYLVQYDIYFKLFITYIIHILYKICLYEIFISLLYMYII